MKCLSHVTGVNLDGIIRTNNDITIALYMGFSTKIFVITTKIVYLLSPHSNFLIFGSLSYTYSEGGRPSQRVSPSLI